MIEIDGSDVTWLACCSCGWRWLALSQDKAWDAAADHERLMHPDDRAARMAQLRHQRRTAA